MSETFKILGYQITFSDENMRYNDLRIIYTAKAQEWNKTFSQRYEAYGSIETVCAKSSDFCEDMLESLADEYIGTLVEKGIYGIDSNTFLKKYGGVLMNSWYEDFDKIEEKYENIIANSQATDAHRTNRRKSRSKWSGGGFGLEGAVKGAATAGALNLASGAMHGAFNIVGKGFSLIGDSINKSSLYSNSKKPLCDAIIGAVYGFLACVCDYENLEMMPLDSDKATAYYNNLSQIANSKDIPDVVTNVLYYDVYLPEIYEYCLESYGDKNGELHRMAGIFRVDLTAIHDSIFNDIVDYGSSETAGDLIKIRQDLISKMLEYGVLKADLLTDKINFDIDCHQLDKINGDITQRIYNSLDFTDETKTIESKKAYLNQLGNLSIEHNEKHIGTVQK